VPVAVNCWLFPAAIDALPGVTERDRRSGAVTATPTEFAIAPEAAVILAVPIAVPVTSPPAVTGAIADESDVQTTEVVTSCVLPSV
jgi:hypothetical protein